MSIPTATKNNAANVSRTGNIFAAKLCATGNITLRTPQCERQANCLGEPTRQMVSARKSEGSSLQVRFMRTSNPGTIFRPAKTTGTSSRIALQIFQRTPVSVTPPEEPTAGKQNRQNGDCDVVGEF